MLSDTPAGPTEPKARLASVDAVRGFALFGVLLVNMYNFGAYSSEWTGALDRVSFTLMHAVFETKSWRLFAFLFGFGFALQMMKAEQLSTPILWRYSRRLVILFIIGMLHALCYDGDILMQYAMLGLVLLAFKSVPKSVLLVLALLLLAAFPVGNMVVSLTVDEPFSGDEQSVSLEERREGHEYLGSVVDVVKANVSAIPPHIWSGLHNPESSLAVFAMFLLGLYAGRSRFFHAAREHLPFIKRVFAWGIGIGASAAIAEWGLGYFFGYAVFLDHDAGILVQFVGDLLFAYGSTALAFGYAAGIVLLAEQDGWQSKLRPLQHLGRMALTVYLSGTVMFTLLFYGYGAGQLFLIGPAGTTAYAILFFGIQVLFCGWWLNRFRFGPMEWLWRSLTNGKAQPFRIAR
jgi:uncharacterized protein